LQIEREEYDVAAEEKIDKTDSDAKVVIVTIILFFR